MALVIQELGGKRRELTLKGQAGPLTGAMFPGVEQRGEVARYLGSPVGTAIQSGPTQLPTEFEFAWHRETLVGGVAYLTSVAVDPSAPVGVGNAFAEPDDLIDLVYDMVAQGSRVKVTLGARSSIGVLRRMEPVGGREGRNQVTLTIDYVDTLALRPRTPRPPSPQSTIDAIRAGWGEALATIRRPITMAKSLIDDVGEGVALFNESIRRTASVVAEYRGAVRSLDSLSSGFAEGLTSTISAGTALRDLVDKPGSTLAQSDDAQATLKAVAFRAKTQQRVNQIRRRAALDRDLHRVASDDRVIAVHLANEGEDLRFVAAVYYGAGTADAWREIARFNRLSSSLLTAGQRVLIPRLAVAA